MPTFQPATSIHDAAWSPLPNPAPGEISPLLSFEDHWLRRFGRIDALRLDSGQVHRGLRQVADEVWALLDGAVVIELHDGRSGSPSFGVSQTHHLHTPARVLVPFGVEIRLEARRPSLLVRLMTHSEAEDPPGTLAV